MPAQTSNPAAKKSAPPDTSPKPTPPSPKGIHDVIAATFSATCGDPDDATKALDFEAIKTPLESLAKEETVTWTGSELYKIAHRAVPGISKDVDKEQAYIFHVNHWTASHKLVSSDWYVYRDAKNGKLKSSGYTATGDQSLYGLKRALIVGIEVMDDGKSGSLKFDYKISAVQGTPENAQALGQLISALLGLSLKEFALETGCSVLTGAALQNGTKHLPFDLNVAESAYDQTKLKDDKPDTQKASSQPATPGVADCSTVDKGDACKLSRTFTSVDKEWWDVGIAVAIPGVRETKYSIVNNVLKASPTTHTDAYALFDIYPFASLVTKGSGVPHFAVGLPLTGQTFYRPFFGMSENLTGWTHVERWSGVPTLNFFAGVVYMKTSVVSGSPTSAAELAAAQRSVRVTKALFGIEVPVKSLISKVGKSKNSNGADPSKSSKKTNQNGNGS